jgi:hypothetical protein
VAFAAPAGDLVGHSIQNPGEDRHGNREEQPATHGNGIPTLKGFESSGAQTVDSSAPSSLTARKCIGTRSCGGTSPPIANESVTSTAHWREP